MRKWAFFLFCVVLPLLSVTAGVGAGIVKATAKTWDEMAKVVLKAGRKQTTSSAGRAGVKAFGRAVGTKTASATVKAGAKTMGKEVGEKATSAAVKSMSKALGTAAKEYGDDVVLRLATKAPQLAVRTAGFTERTILRECGKAGMRTISNLPAEEITRVVGAIERNPSVAKVFVEHIEKGGQHFVDKIFALQGSQIMAGGLSAAAIVGVYGLTAPSRADGEAINGRAAEIRKFLDDPNTPGEIKQQYIEEAAKTVNHGTAARANGDLVVRCGVAIGIVVLATGLVVGWIMRVARRSRMNARQSAEGVADCGKSSFPPRQANARFHANEKFPCAMPDSDFADLCPKCGLKRKRSNAEPKSPAKKPAADPAAE